MINKLKFYLSLITARCVYTGIKLLNRSSGTSFVGMVVLKICPDFLTHCSKYIKKRIVTITGTNGKSTTSGLIAHILETAHQNVIHNLKGANMLTGVANVFALSVSPLKRFDYAVIESDEAYLTKLYDYLKSDYLVVTNLFRDQLAQRHLAIHRSKYSNLSYLIHWYTRKPIAHLYISEFQRRHERFD